MSAPDKIPLPYFAQIVDEDHEGFVSRVWKDYFLSRESAGSGVQSVNGTTDRITVTGDPVNPVVDISSAYDAMIAAEIAAAIAELSAVHPSVVATENIPAFAVVTSKGKNADSGVIAGIGKVIGIADAAIASGFSGTVTMIGDITNTGWSWVAGDVIYLNGTSLSTVAPSTGFSQKIGTAKNSNTVYVELGEAYGL